MIELPAGPPLLLENFPKTCVPPHIVSLHLPLAMQNSCQPSVGSSGSHPLWPLVLLSSFAHLPHPGPERKESSIQRLAGSGLGCKCCCHLGSAPSEVGSHLTARVNVLSLTDPLPVPKEAAPAVFLRVDCLVRSAAVMLPASEPVAMNSSFFQSLRILWELRLAASLAFSRAIWACLVTSGLLKPRNIWVMFWTHHLLYSISSFISASSPFEFSSA